MPTKLQMEKALQERHGRSVFEKFSQAKVAVCGLGGLGSNIAISLARAGVGKLILIDFDKVDISNLHRQQYKASQLGIYKTDALAANLKEIAPYIEVTFFTEKITEENICRLLAEADIVCEAFDKAKEKAMLVNTVLEKMPEKYLIAASGMAGMESANSIRTRQITKHFYLCGDEVSEVEIEGTLFSTRVMVCAAHQAHMVLRILAGMQDM
ncbi:MAG: thiamine biosynthesis protein ThiF [Lachnospiraceae bacterium]|nr:thiamine biosynthesis protein ThiF [Lachnospiraceae bacterium]